MKSLFLTGASGFVGRGLLSRLPAGARVTILTRNPDALSAVHPPEPGWQYLKGDITQADTYNEALTDDTTVLHLAATTGKAPASEYFRVIDGGTRHLLRECKRRGVPRLVFVSTIAAGFSDQRHYPYAQAKATAEQAVRESSLDWLIARPTMVLGPNSPAMSGLATLAGAPVTLVPGRGEVVVQPIARDDMATILLALAETHLGRETVDLGGPDRVSMIDLLRQIRFRLRGSLGPVFHLPLGAMRQTLSWLEPAMLKLLPLTAGQLASFANDGVARPHPLTDRFVATLTPLPAMLKHVGR